MANLVLPLPLRAPLLAFLLLSGSVGAQPVFKSVMPDGSVLYSEKPAAGAKRVDKLDPPPPSSGITGLTADEKARAEQLSRQRATSAAADEKTRQAVGEAEKLLARARAAQESGKEPLPGERTGIAGGGTRLTDAYLVRQKALAEAVAAAEKNLAQSRPGAR